MGIKAHELPAEIFWLAYPLETAVAILPFFVRLWRPVGIDITEEVRAIRDGQTAA